MIKVNIKTTSIKELKQKSVLLSTLCYSSNTKDVAVEFVNTHGNTQEIISRPVSLISEATETVKFTTEKLAINSLSNPVVYDELKVTPGVRYNLIIEIDARCIDRKSVV